MAAKLVAYREFRSVQSRALVPRRCKLQLCGVCQNYHWLSDIAGMDGKVSRTLFLFCVASLIIHGMLEYSRSSMISLLLDVWLTTWEVNRVLFI